MGASTGKEYIERMRELRPNVIIDGEVVTSNIPDHPAFSGIVKTYAELFEMQHDPELTDTLTYTSPSTGDKVATSFMVPHSVDDLVKRREAAITWARYSCGMLGRTGDYLNSALMALSEAQSWFEQADPVFGQNAKTYYEQARENDWLATHTLVPPQINRSVPLSQQGGGKVAAHIVKEDDNGVVISGARMLATIGPTSDELLVFPSTVLRGTAEDDPYSFAFAIPTDAKGLKMICRKPLDHGQGHFNEPLASRFEEMDAVVVFEDVHVPFERIFMLGHADLCNGFYGDTGATAHMTHQVVARTTAKSEFYAGLLLEMAEAIGIDQFPHIQDDIREVLVAAEIGRASLVAAEVQGETNEFGVFTPRWETLNAIRNWYPRICQRWPAIVRKFGAGGLMALPDEKDVMGTAKDDIATYYQGKNVTGEQRTRLFRLAFDAAVSSFAGRQFLYEHYFFGDPIRMASAYVKATPTDDVQQRVRDLLARAD